MINAKTLDAVAKKLRSHGEEAGDAASNMANEYGSEIRGRVNELVDSAQQSYGDAAKSVRGTISEQPLISLLAAGAIGLVAGIFIANR